MQSVSNATSTDLFYSPVELNLEVEEDLALLQESEDPPLFVKMRFEYQKDIVGYTGVWNLYLVHYKLLEEHLHNLPKLFPNFLLFQLLPKKVLVNVGGTTQPLDEVYGAFEEYFILVPMIMQTENTSCSAGFIQYVGVHEINYRPSFYTATSSQNQDGIFFVEHDSLLCVCLNGDIMLTNNLQSEAGDTTDVYDEADRKQIFKTFTSESALFEDAQAPKFISGSRVSHGAIHNHYSKFIHKLKEQLEEVTNVSESV